MAAPTRTRRSDDRAEPQRTQGAPATRPPRAGGPPAHPGLRSPAGRGGGAVAGPRGGSGDRPQPSPGDEARGAPPGALHRGEARAGEAPRRAPGQRAQPARGSGGERGAGHGPAGPPERRAGGVHAHRPDPQARRPAGRDGGGAQGGPGPGGAAAEGPCGRAGVGQGLPRHARDAAGDVRQGDGPEGGAPLREHPRWRAPAGRGRAHGGRGLRALLRRRAPAAAERGAPRSGPHPLRGVRRDPRRAVLHGLVLRRRIADGIPGVIPGGSVSPALAVGSLRPRWIEPPAPDAAVVAALAGSLRLPEAVCAVLASRGHSDPDGAKRFLRPLLEHLHDPADLADGLRAAARLVEAGERGETIFVHGDYDVDGVCATALYTRFLRGVGAHVVPFVPHRLRDGYDFSAAGLRAALEARAAVVLTADCGTLAAGPVAQACSAGLDVVVTDHHALGPGAASPWALVNPHRADCPYPDKSLCGAGVAFKVCELVRRALGQEPEALLGLLDLVALATVADLVPLEGENRVLVRFGMRRFAATRVAGVAALLAKAGVDPSAVTAGQLGFVVAPRLNAAGRLSDSADALRLMLTDDPREAEALADALEVVNRERQAEDRRTLDEAMALLAREYDPERDYGVVLAADGWHPGVIGIVASRVVERIHRPTILIALDGEKGRGSARSIPGFHLHEALLGCADHLGRFGGHRQAAGLDVARSAVPALREAFNARARSVLVPEDLRPVLRPDLELRLAEVDLELVRWLEYLGPHGVGNPRPVFLVRGVRLSGARRVGDGHLKVTVEAGGSRLDAIGFGLADRHPPDSLTGAPHDVLVRLERNEYRGVARPQAQIVDLRDARGLA
ncbi:MAG: single-stranded-DNA-specific exonuclease RecJ [Gemmatimonadetes bacterium]|nr:single-stranded-DNA-specific exonuclease RecJ [Gemmatimonadota bacterium]